MASEASIISIFYARFHDEHGPKVLHQVPEGSIIPCPPSPTAIKDPYIDFQSISSYLIPYREFCNRPLSICSNGYRILGHPICITDSAKYDRNDFIFNFCIVLNDKDDWTPFRGVITKLAKLFANLEEQDSFLSKEEQDATIVMAGEEGYGGEKGSKVFAVVEMVFEDLGSFGETMIPIDESNTLSLSLFPIRATPPHIQLYHVPLSVVRFESLQTSAWDLTVQRILPHINGINSVARISELTDTDQRLARRAIQHLVYYDCVLLLDIFSFTAIYAPTPVLADFIASTSMQDECRKYVYSRVSPFSHTGGRLGRAMTSEPDNSRKNSRPASGKGVKHHSLISASLDDPAAFKWRSYQSHDGPSTPAPAQNEVWPTRMQLIDLYALFRQGLPLREYCIHRSAQLHSIDIRRLVTFGVIKGFLYRVHKYVVRTSNTSSKEASTAQADPITRNDQDPASKVTPAAESATALLSHEQKKEQRTLAKLAEVEEEAYRSAALSSGWRLPAARTTLPAHPTARSATSGPVNTTATTTTTTAAAAAAAAAVATTAVPLPAANNKTGRQLGTPEGTATEVTTGSSSMGTSAARRKEDREVLRFADGLSSLDEICVELKTTEARALERIKAAASGVGDVVVVAR